MKLIIVLSTLVFCFSSSAEEYFEPTPDPEKTRKIPVIKDGKVVGHKFVALKTGSKYKKLGLKRGDVIRAVNGVPVGSPQEAMELYQSLKDGEAHHIEVDRASQ